MDDWELRASDELTVLAWAGYFPPTFAWTGSSTIWTASGRIDHQFALTDQGPGARGLSLDVFGQRAVFASGGFVATLAGETWSVSQPLASTSSMTGAPERVGLGPDGLARLWWQRRETDQYALLTSQETPSGWSSPMQLDHAPVPVRGLLHASGPRSVAAWSRDSTTELRDSTTVVQRSDLDGGFELIQHFVAQAVLVGASGAIWLVGQVVEPGEVRSIALVCP